VGDGLGVGEGVGDGVGVGEVVGDAVPPPPPPPEGAFLCFCFGIDPVGVNDDPIDGVAATFSVVTADGAWALSSFFAVALPMPNAAPNATTTAATAMAAKRPGVIRCTSSSASTFRRPCSGWSRP
jgi:hypothetical protein